MTSGRITDTAILVGYSGAGECVYSTEIPLETYWDGEHVWDESGSILKLGLVRLSGRLYDETGILFSEFESNFDAVTGGFVSGWARDSDGQVVHHTA